MNRSLYLDHAATTPPTASVIEAVNHTLSEVWGNPSSVHAAGLAASRLREEARGSILRALGVRNAVPGQLIFTASGTEADNLAILGTAKAKNHGSSPCLITTDSEHPAIAAPAAELEKQGWQVIRMKTEGGVIDPDAFASQLNERVVLVSLMTANNETGAIYDLKALFSLVHKHCPKAVTHTDAVQAFGKLPLSPEKLGADMLTVSAHKIGGIKGAGALYLSRDMIKRRILSPLLYGGGQEGGMRSGTESLPCIVGFGQAAADMMQITPQRINEQSDALRAHLLKGLDSRVRVNQPRGAFLPGIVSLTLPGIRSEIMLRFLSERGIYVSAGSACSSHKNTASPVLLAFGLTNADADCTLRVSLSHDQSPEDLDRFNEGLREGLDSLAKLRETRK